MNGKSFTFTVVSTPREVPSSAEFAGILVVDNWDDWFEFSTVYVVLVFDASGHRHDVGSVKIGQFKMRRNQRRPAIPNVFASLDERFFSLGQDDSYYERLNALGNELRDRILTGLRDVAVDQELFQRALKERVTTISLLRSVTPTSVQGQFRRLALGGARLSRYKFSYTAPRRVASKQPPVVLSFQVEPESNPPTNIHVLIGRNGVGKTYILNLMTQALVDKKVTGRQAGSFSFETSESPSNPFVRSVEDSQPFANVVSVTFSAFDPFEPLPEQKDRSAGVQYSYIGLKRSSNTGEGIGSPKSPEMLTREFVNSVRACMRGARAVRWRRALEALEADPIFKEAEMAALAGDDGNGEFEKRASSIFGRLSSGHKIVLLTITRLVETVEERTLVLLDEPEAHLHPPLLSAFVRSLSDLLVNRNGVAIVATHSPVVLQEVPRNCAWKLRRTGHEATAERPEIETFGENVGVLTREAFGLEVTHSGFHKLLQDSIKDQRQFEAVLERFGEQLGTEARAIARALIAERDSGNKS
jgi:predicted ATPase